MSIGLFEISFSEAISDDFIKNLILTGMPFVKNIVALDEFWNLSAHEQAEALAGC